MNWVTISISASFGLLMTLFFVLLLTAIIFNMKSAEKYRQQVANAIHSLRLGSMLSALGVDISQYVHKNRMVEVHTHMLQCSSCQQNSQCDEELASNSISIETVHFCNNKKHLHKLVLQQQTVD